MAAASLAIADDERTHSTWVGEGREDSGRWRRARIEFATLDLVPGPITSARTIRLPEEWAERPR